MTVRLKRARSYRPFCNRDCRRLVFPRGFGRLFSERPGVIVDGIVKYDSIIPAVLSGLSDVIIGIVVILVLSASMSTLSSLVMTSSSTLTLDLIDGFIIKNMGDKQKLCCMRILIAVFVALSVAIAVKPPMFIAQLMGVSWGALAGSFLGPFMYGLYSKSHARWRLGRICHRRRDNAFITFHTLAQNT